MEHLAHFIFGVFGNVSALFVFLAPLITFKRILMKRSTEQFSGIPYLMTLANCLFSAWYGLPFVSPNNLLLSTINIAAGAAIESTYVLIFLVFSPKKEKEKMLILLLSILAMFGAVVLVTLFALPGGHKRTLFCGVVNTLVAIFMFASPLTVIRSVIKTTSVEFMPFSLSLCVFLCGTSWFVFGLIGRDCFVVIQNGFGCGSGIVQLVLYAMYYKKKKEEGTTKQMMMNAAKVEDHEQENGTNNIINHIHHNNGADGQV